MGKIGFLFPGQGAQHVGMGKTLFETSENAKRLFAQADEILGYSLSSVCFEGPDDRLNSTAFSQPALFVCSLAAIEKLREESDELVKSCEVAAGLSLGEYTALTFAGAIEFSDALRVVQTRGEAMQDAADNNPSGMVSVLGVIEESRLTPFATADVRFSRQLPDEPTIGRVDRDRLALDVLPLNKRLVAALDETSEMMVDVMLGVPIVPSQMPIQRLHVVAATDHESVGAIDVVRAVDVLADFLRRVLSGVQVLAAEVGQSPIRRQLVDELDEARVLVCRQAFLDEGLEGVGIGDVDLLVEARRVIEGHVALVVDLHPMDVLGGVIDSHFLVAAEESVVEGRLTGRVLPDHCCVAHASFLGDLVVDVEGG